LYLALIRYRPLQIAKRLSNQRHKWNVITLASNHVGCCK
jgi:hypothetical protein